jgi:ABC-type Fe3+/spermidine/putrescine transport system ATPase subunit
MNYNELFSKEELEQINKEIENLWKAPDWSIFNQTSHIKIYDSEKYELIEKKGYRIKEIKAKLGNLQNSILLSKRDIEKYEELLLKEKQEVARERELVIKLEQELQELESKKKE